MNIFVFSGGGAFATPELGIAKYLREKQIYNPQEDIAIGTSFGAITSGALVYNFDEEDIAQMMTSFEQELHNLMQITSVFWSGLRFLSKWGIADLMAILAPFFGAKVFLGNLYTVATNVQTMSPHIWGTHSGISPLEAIASSASMPFAFTPVAIGNSLYIDGGVFENVPVNAVKYIDLEHDSANIYVIGSLPKGKFHYNPTNLFQYVDGLINGMTFALNKATLELPQKYQQITYHSSASNVFDFGVWKEDIQNGYVVAKNFFKK